MAYQITMFLLAALPGFAAGLPSFFIPNTSEPNTSEIDPAIRFLVQTPDLRAGFSAKAAVFQMHDRSLRVRFAGASPETTVVGADRLAAEASFFLGDQPKKWRTGLPLYQKILYRNLYPGIDMTYAGAGRRIKSEFLIAPGADPRLIRLEYSGIADLTIEIDSGGDLIVRGEDIEAREESPLIYQESASGRVRIPGRYTLRDPRTVGFEIGAYDPTLP